MQLSLRVGSCSPGAKAAMADWAMVSLGREWPYGVSVCISLLLGNPI